MTPAQLATLKADIEAHEGLREQPLTEDGNHAIAQAYNLAAAPDFWVFRNSIALGDIYEATSPDGTTWSWPAYSTRTHGRRDAWLLLTRRGSIDLRQANVRVAVADIFSGTGAPATQRAHLLALARRKATRGQRLFATGPGTAAEPAICHELVEDEILPAQVDAARRLP
jgi:hypothetical protein